MGIDALLTIITVIISVATSSATLGYWLASKFKEVEFRFRNVELRMDRLEGAFNSITSSSSRYWRPGDPKP
ncbi:hypothetical protein [Vulcanisaeta thermophila]|uniref:hypothetical protein n=1 Tax=Vulcanisaeta thermophila TaxID=867917 RepID=UPI00085291D1|nr:hypothetical protein [Vulcanisaeta thermophila]